MLILSNETLNDTGPLGKSLPFLTPKGSLELDCFTKNSNSTHSVLSKSVYFTKSAKLAQESLKILKVVQLIFVQISTELSHVTKISSK